MIVFVFWQEPVIYLKSFVVDNSFLSIFIFIFLMFLSTVFAPLTVLPFVPAVGLVLGSFNTAIYSIIGWILGSIVAFLIARYLGKPVVVRFVPKSDLVKYQKYLPSKINFWWVVFLRMIIPVDVLSYIIGLFTDMGFWKYILASFIGIVPFSFIFSYGYEIVFLKNIPAFILSIIFVIVVLFMAWYFRNKSKV